jgi:hypothetical protein
VFSMVTRSLCITQATLRATLWIGLYYDGYAEPCDRYVTDGTEAVRSMLEVEEARSHRLCPAKKTGEGGRGRGSFAVPNCFSLLAVVLYNRSRSSESEASKPTTAGRWTLKPQAKATSASAYCIQKAAPDRNHTVMFLRL